MEETKHRKALMSQNMFQRRIRASTDELSLGETLATLLRTMLDYKERHPNLLGFVAKHQIRARTVGELDEAELLEAPLRLIELDRDKNGQVTSRELFQGAMRGRLGR